MSEAGPDDHWTDVRMRASSPEPELDALASELRQLNAAVIATLVDRGHLAEARALVAEARTLVEGDLRAGPHVPAPPLNGVRTLELQYSPAMGHANPIAPPMHLEFIDGADGGREVVGTVTLSRMSEGPPDAAHGGATATLLDQALGIANIAAGHPGVTIRLDTRYRSRTPLGTELAVRARHVRVEGRDAHAHATLHDGDRLCVEAFGTFRIVHHLLPERP